MLYDFSFFEVDADEIKEIIFLIKSHLGSLLLFLKQQQFKLVLT